MANEKRLLNEYLHYSTQGRKSPFYILKEEFFLSLSLQFLFPKDAK